VTGQPPAEDSANPNVERVGQARRIPPRPTEVCEEVSPSPNASGGAQLQEQLNARPHAGDAGGKSIVDVERAEDKEAPASAASKEVRDDLARPEEGDRTHGARNDLARHPCEKLAPGQVVACREAQLDAGPHRSRSGERLRGFGRAASTPPGAGLQS
jgi:hypothetical protein